MIISLGDGKHWVGNGMLTDGKIAVVISPSSKKHKIGEKSKIKDKKIYDTDVVIEFDNIESARVVQDAINMAVLRFMGFYLVNKK